MANMKAEEVKKVEDLNEEETVTAETLETTESVEADSAAETPAAAEKTPEVKISSKRQKKIDNRETKAARKARNMDAEKQKRPSNAVIALLIFGVLIVMFGFAWGYNYFSKEASIQTYIENNGGEDAFSNIQVDEKTIMSVSAKDNDITVNLDMVAEESADEADFYTSEEGEAYLKYIGAYYLSSMKPETRAVSANADVIININGEKVKSVSLKYSEAEKATEEYTKMMQDKAGEE